MLANPALPRTFAIPRPVGLGHITFAAAGAVVWIHLLDAAFVHPQANANLFEHVVQGVVALLAGPLAFLAYPRLTPGRRAAAALAIGLGTMSTGIAIHIVGVIKNSTWRGSDYTGVPMAFAGLALIVLGVVLLAAAIPRWRYRALLLPAAPVAAFFVVLPVVMSVYVTHAPRYIIEPQDLGAAYEEVSFQTPDGLTLRGWYVPSKNGAAVAVMHGSGGARIRPLAHVRMLAANGYGVLVFDSRGHGESDGATNALGWNTAADAAGAADYLATRADVEPGRIGILGVSMGAEIALTSAAEDDGFAAIVADGPSGRTLADTLDTPGGWLGKIVPVGVAFGMEIGTIALSQSMPDDALTDLSPKVEEPVLYIASGTVSDERRLVTKIADRSAGEHELWVVEGAGHTGGIKVVPGEYERRVTTFFAHHLLAD